MHIHRLSVRAAFLVSNEDSITRREYERRHAALLVKIVAAIKDIEQIRGTLRATENRMDERATSLNSALDKASVALDKRLEVMNEFRAQLSTERGSYITREQLDLVVKAIDVKIDAVKSLIDPLQNQTSYAKGRDNTLAAIILAGTTILVAVILAVLR